MDVLSVWDQFEVPYIWTQMEYLLRILIAAFLGLLIGNERKNRNKSAGIRTHAIVALGAALMMVVSKYGFFDGYEADASRIAAQVVSGVGFLGAGVIFVRNNLVNGLTTAAAVATIEQFLTGEHIEIAGLQIKKTKKDEIKLEFDVVFPPGLNQSAFMAKLAERDDVLTVSK